MGRELREHEKPSLGIIGVSSPGLLRLRFGLVPTPCLPAAAQGGPQPNGSLQPPGTRRGLGTAEDSLFATACSGRLRSSSSKAGLWPPRARAHGRHRNVFRKGTESLHSLLEKHGVISKLSVLATFLRLQNISYFPLKSGFPNPPENASCHYFKMQISIFYTA